MHSLQHSFDEVKIKVVLAFAANVFFKKPQIFGTRCPYHAEAGASVLEGVKYSTGTKMPIELKSLSARAPQPEGERERWRMCRCENFGCSQMRYAVMEA